MKIFVCIARQIYGMHTEFIAKFRNLFQRQRQSNFFDKTSTQLNLQLFYGTISPLTSKNVITIVGLSTRKSKRYYIVGINASILKHIEL